MEILVFLLFAAAAGAAAYLSYYLKQKRRQELAGMARQLGLDFSARDTLGCLALPFALFTKGNGRGTENLLYGTWQGMPVREFDYWYYEESTDSQGRRSKTYHRYSCALTEIQAACPHLTIDRENLFTRLADHLGLGDIEFELDEFNRAFNVKGKDRKFANDFIDQRMMRWLLQADAAFQFEVCATWLLCFSKRRRPTDLIPLIGTTKGFRDQVPPVVHELYGLGASR
ncbi:MAG TPA: hypothetical protein VE646_14220 [Actinomycetota bacterium]|nr:hypothetical protein [Actinomycetota bacterium]